MALLAAGCLYDRGDRCGSGQRLDDQGLYCQCLDGLVPDPGGRGVCVACPAHERAAGTRCECTDGFSRPAPDKACEPATAGLGEACDATRPCAVASFPHCQATGSTSGYCTSTGCATSQDCRGGFACVDGASGRYCKRPPVGQNKSCAGDADCAGTEATLCDTLYSKRCLVQGCKVDDPSTCHEGFRCCDLSGFGLAKTVCVDLPQCPGAAP